jgi:hypothetical protein
MSMQSALLSLPTQRLDAPQIFGSDEFSDDETCRYEMRKWWDTALPWCAWLMLNPSHARADRSDMTNDRCNAFARRWGYGGNIVVNLYPLVSPAPAVMWAWQDTEAAKPHLERNKDSIRRAGEEADLLIVAFGAQPGDRDPYWRDLCLGVFSGVSGKPLHCIGTNLDGSPKHPLARGRNRVSDDQQPILWRAA